MTVLCYSIQQKGHGQSHTSFRTLGIIWKKVKSIFILVYQGQNIDQGCYTGLEIPFKVSIGFFKTFMLFLSLSTKLFLPSQNVRTEENVCEYQDFKSLFLHYASCPQKNKYKSIIYVRVLHIQEHTSTDPAGDSSKMERKLEPRL